MSLPPVHVVADDVFVDHSLVIFPNSTPFVLNLGFILGAALCTVLVIFVDMAMLVAVNCILHDARFMHDGTWLVNFTLDSGVVNHIGAVHSLVDYREGNGLTLNLGPRDVENAIVIDPTEVGVDSGEVNLGISLIKALLAHV